MVTFFFKNEATHINHGSYGAPPIEVMNFQKNMMGKKLKIKIDQMEFNALKFLKYTYKEYVQSTIKSLSKYINAEEENVVLVENASAGFNSVLKSFNWKRNDKILYLSIEYGSVKIVINYVNKLL
jgi:histidinol-phosphate/aromatic aminotransferase/cobyric acid decarboxylase-like protein